MKKQKHPTRAALTVLFIFIVFNIILITMLIIGAVGFYLIKTGRLGSGRPGTGLHMLIIMFAVASIIIGTVVSAVISHLPLKPINTLVNGMNRLSNGEYDTRISLGNHKIGRELSDSFNTLAEELQNTEMLRSDFVNNFSHEFKTPIVSIRGFAKLLMKDGVSEHQRVEYLKIIADESERLADMATNVLNLTKIENQSILTDITTFNLSEQIRNCVLLLEKKWVSKDLNMSVDFDEYNICGNEELLKKVWINLIDNAIKFSTNGGEVSVFINKDKHTTSVSVCNNGTEINESDNKRIFNKFYQGDTSHSSEGTGTGLAIAKKIVELHNGSITVESNDKHTVFKVLIPDN